MLAEVLDFLADEDKTLRFNLLKELSYLSEQDIEENLYSFLKYEHIDSVTLKGVKIDGSWYPKKYIKKDKEDNIFIANWLLKKRRN